MSAPDAPAVARARTGALVQRLVLGVAVAGTVLIATGAFWLSFTSLSQLARRCGIAAGRAWVWPLIVDGVIVVATVSVVVMSGGGWDRRAVRYAWVLLLAGACVSVLANASQALIVVDARVPVVLAALVAAVPPVVLVAITHLTVKLTHRPAPHPASSRAAATPSTQADAAAVRASRPVRARRTRERGAAQRALALRSQSSLSNREIAARLGVHPSTVGRWLASERTLVSVDERPGGRAGAPSDKRT